jgi:hypothetical protein
MWLVKWLLAIPHYIVLVFLWAAFAVLSVVAFFAILFTARYPRAIFDFNVGVLRWSWRVSYYAYGALGTDRYPPFALREVEDYPAKLEIAYPERLSRGLVLVKWWLLAIPHYLIVGILAGGSWWAWRSDDWQSAGFGLIGLLALIAAVILMFTGTYPKPMFDLILGFNRWVLRVAAYAGLMTDRYPPFRLDQGGTEGGSTLTVPPGTPGASSAAMPRSAWGAGSVVALIVGVLLAFVGVGTGAAGGIALWADQTQRDSAGFLVSPSETLDTSAHALVAEDIDIHVDGAEGFYPSDLLGEARVRVTSEGDEPIFVGVARANDAYGYLDGVSYAKTYGFGGDVEPARQGGAPSTAPADAGFWRTSSEGTGTQTLHWPVEEGSWTVVAMNADGSPGVSVTGDAGLEIPELTWIAVALIVAGGVLLLIAAGVIVAATARAQKRGRESLPAA